MSQIQALNRTQPWLPLKPGRCGTMTHDYKRHGTTTLFAALNVLEGTVIGRCMQRHRHEEFIRFLNAVERVVPAGRISRLSSTTMPPTSIREGEGLARAASAPDVPLHANIWLLAERGRDVLLYPHAPAHTARHLPLHRQPASRNQLLSRRAQSAASILAKLARLPVASE